MQVWEQEASWKAEVGVIAAFGHIKDSHGEEADSCCICKFSERFEEIILNVSSNDWYENKEKRASSVVVIKLWDWL